MRTALALTAIAIAAGATIAAPAGIASAERSAIETIGLLEAQGFTVNIDRVGSAPLSECIVTDVRNPQTVTRLVRVNRGGGIRLGGGGDGGRDRDDSFLIEEIVSKSISVTLDCSR